VKKALKRVFERRRAATKDRFGEPGSIRGSLQPLLRMQTAHHTLAQARRRG